MTERKLCSNCDYQKSVGMSIACQRCFNKSLWKPRSKTMSKQELLNYISEKYGNDKKANKLKRIVFIIYICRHLL